MKVLVLNQVACASQGLPDEGVADVSDALGKALIDAGYAEEVKGKKVEHATAAPGEKHEVSRPKSKGLTTDSLKGK
jgi:hypothetical protein